jgi:hypothetical protein
MIQLLGRAWAWLVKKHRPNLKVPFPDPILLRVSCTKLPASLPYHDSAHTWHETRLIFLYLTVGGRAVKRSNLCGYYVCEYMRVHSFYGGVARRGDPPPSHLYSVYGARHGDAIHTSAWRRHTL